MQEKHEPEQYICTFSGQQFSFDQFDPAAVRIEDIAHALSWVNRFTGHTYYGWSVASHSLAVSSYLWANSASPAAQLGGLLHDAHEAYMGDVATPLKRYFDVSAELLALGISEQDIKRLKLAFKAREDAVQAAVAEGLGVDVSLLRLPEVKHADLVALYVERHALLPETRRKWRILQGISQSDCFGMAPPRREPHPEVVARRFVERYRELCELARYTKYHPEGDQQCNLQSALSVQP